MELFCQILDIVSTALIGIVDAIFGAQLSGEVTSLLGDLVSDFFGCL